MQRVSQILFGIGYPQSSADLDIVLNLPKFNAGGGVVVSDAEKDELCSKRMDTWIALLVYVVLAVVAWIYTFKTSDLSEDEQHRYSVIFWTVAGLILLWLLGRLFTVYVLVDWTMRRWRVAHMNAGGCAPKDWKCIWKALL